MNAKKENMVKRVTRELSDKELKDAVREVFCWFKDGDLKENGMLPQVANEIERISDCGDYIRMRLAEENILTEAARRYVK